MSSRVVRRRIRLAVLTVGLVVVASTLRSEESAPPADDPKGVLSGRVVTPEGDPAAGATVKLFRDDYETKPRVYRLLESIETDGTGAYEFSDLPKGWYLVTAGREGSAKTFRYFVLEAGLRLSQEFVLRTPVASAVAVRDEAGRPVAGARLRFLNPRDENGEFWARSRGDWETFGGNVPPSDESGRLQLPDLPEGAVVTAVIEQDDYAPVEIKDVRVGSEFAADVVMRPGAAVSLKIDPAADGRTVDEAEIDFRHDPFSHPSSVIYRRVPLSGDGAARLTVEPGRYSLLRLTHEEFFILPEYMPDITEGDYLRIGDGGNEFRFRLRPKVTVRGRLIDASSGQPLAQKFVYGEVPNHEPGVAADARPVGAPEEWAVVGLARTDDAGEYSIELAAGPARVTFQDEGYLGETTRLEFDVASDGSTVAPDMLLRPLPVVTGTVLDQGGRPVAGAVVRFRGGLRYLQPVATDEAGRFTLTPTWVPVDEETGERQTAHPLVAFHPHERLVVRTTVRLDEPETLKDLTLTLGPEQPGTIFDGYPEESSPAERGDAAQERLAELAEKALIGQAAPELDGTWLNAEKPAEGLAAFRGQYVLLDFWFIGCGPCHADFPSVKLLHDLYKDRGLVVIAVHDNSATAETVRAFAEKEGMTTPIVVDEADGRTVARYEGRGMSGYPSHLLIGPDGTVIDDDRTTPGPSLRAYKVEVVRELLLGK